MARRPSRDGSRSFGGEGRGGASLTVSSAPGSERINGPFTARRWRQAPRLITCTRRLRGSGRLRRGRNEQAFLTHPNRLQPRRRHAVLALDVAYHCLGPALGQRTIVVRANRPCRCGPRYGTGSSPDRCSPAPCPAHRGSPSPRASDRPSHSGSSPSGSPTARRSRPAPRQVPSASPRRRAAGRPLPVSPGPARRPETRLGPVQSPLRMVRRGGCRGCPRNRFPLGFSELMIWSADGLLWAKTGAVVSISGARISGVINLRTSVSSNIRSSYSYSTETTRGEKNRDRVFSRCSYLVSAGVRHGRA